MCSQPYSIHSLNIHINYSFLLFSLFFLLLFNFYLLLFLQFLSILFLNDEDSFVKFMKEMSKFRVDFVDKIREVSGCFIVNVFEEKYRSIVFLEVLHFFRGNFILENLNYALCFSRLDVLCQINHFFL